MDEKGLISDSEFSGPLLLLANFCVSDIQKNRNVIQVNKRQETKMDRSLQGDNEKGS